MGCELDLSEREAGRGGVPRLRESGRARQGLQGVLKSELASKGVSCLQKPTCLDFLHASCLGQRESRVRWGPGTHPAVGVRVQLPPGSLGT